MFHTLRKNARTAIPYGHIYFDTETNFHVNQEGNTEHTLKLGVAIYVRYNKDLKIISRKVFRFKNTWQFWEFVMKRIGQTQRIVIFAHNIFFDLWVTQFYLQAFKAGWTSKIPYTKGLMYIDRIKKGKQSIDLVNVGNYFKRDAEILEKVMLGWFQFIKNNDLGNFGLTLPSQAFNAYRHKFMGTKLYLHRPGQPERLERQSYKGGRVECFFIGKAPKDTYYKLDINSMYPYVMANRDYPYRCMYALKNPALTRLEPWLSEHCVIAEVEIDTPEPVYPVYHEGKTIFPVGHFIVTLTTPSLKYALSHGHIKEIKEVGLYNKANIFKDYVNYFYGKRKEYQKAGNDIYQYACKILLNSLYGKFGQKSRIEKTVDYSDNMACRREEIIDIRTGRLITEMIFGGKKRITEINEVESFNSFCAIASHVTDYARMLLWSYIKKAKPKTLFYCDTDCLIVNSEGYKTYENEIEPNSLGAFKIEDVSTDLEIRGLKHYRFGKDWKRKGVRKQAEQISDYQFVMDIWPGFPLVFRQKMTEPYTVYKQEKNLTEEYTKGEVQFDGWVKPIRIGAGVHKSKTRPTL